MKNTTKLSCKHFFDRYAAMLYGTLLRHLGSQAGAEKIMSETLLIATSDCETREGEEYNFAQLLRIALSLSAEWLKTAQVNAKPANGSAEHMEYLFGPVANGETKSEQSERGKILRCHLKTFRAE